MADLSSGDNSTSLPLGSPGEGHLFQSGVLRVILGPPLVQASAPSGRSGDSVLASVPHRRLMFNKGDVASYSELNYSVLTTKLVLRIELFCTNDKACTEK